jgi:Uma2 family endonuclease
MSTITPTGPLTAPAISNWLPSPTSIYRITVDEYEAMVDSGFLGKRHRIHLIDGILVRKMTKKPPHVIACERTRNALLRIVPPGWRVTTEAPLRIPDVNEPEPDLAVVRGDALDEEFEQRHPEPADVVLLVEVAHSSLDEDLKMAGIYAGARIPFYWILDVVQGQVLVYSQPGPSGYGACEVLMPGHVIPVVIDGVEVGEVPVAEILPRAAR